jgi:glucosamine-6-phosphate deaminase
MEVNITKEAASASNLAARRIARLVKGEARRGHRSCHLQHTPLGLYEELIRMHREEGLDFSRMRTFNLDEDIGLSPDHPASYHSFMEKNFFHGVNIPQGYTHLPDGLAKIYLDEPAASRLERIDYYQ